MSHYSKCSFLFGILKFICSDIVSSNPLKRLGLIEPTHDSLAVVACMFSAYHHTKFMHAPTLSSCEHILDGECLNHNQQNACLESFAEAFKAEAAEFRLPTRSFDLYSFRAFLVQSSRV